MRSVWLFGASAILVSLAVPASSHGARMLASPQLGGKGGSAAPSLCPPGTLPDLGACVRVTDDDGFTTGEVEPNAHHERSGRYVVYDQIPRRPDRPSDYDAYRYPVPPGLAGGHSVISGYDLDKPDDRQRRGRTLHAVGHGAVDLPQAKGTPISMIALDHQEGDAKVIFVGPLFGNTVISLHTIHEASGPREYVLLFGHLDAPTPGLAKGSVLREGDIVGTVGDSGSPELVHLHLEARRVREGRDVEAAASGAAILDESIVTDPRNVLPLR